MDAPSHHFFQHLTERTRQCRKIRKRVGGGIIAEKEITKVSLLAGNMTGHTENSKKVTQLELVIKLDTNAGFKINRLLKRKKSPLWWSKPSMPLIIQG